MWELSVSKLKFGRLVNSKNCCFGVINGIFHPKFDFLLFWLKLFFLVKIDLLDFRNLKFKTNLVLKSMKKVVNFLDNLKYLCFAEKCIFTDFYITSFR